MQLTPNIRAEWCRRDLHFGFTAVTSRASMTEKETYFLRLTDLDTGLAGIGECALFRGLGSDDTPDYADRLAALCADINAGREFSLSSSSIIFGLETAMLDLANGGRALIYDTPWSRGERAITINGLVWMGSEEEMQARIAEKLAAGFRCVKIKIGGIDFDRELSLLEGIRRRFSPDELELRLDANGAFTPAEAPAKLKALSRFGIHSIEQPIRAGQWFAMAALCARSPIPIALDEELIGISDAKRRHAMLATIRPAYIILKPSLCGGLQATREWIADARARRIGWWITSALESNVGLNAIAQLAATQHLRVPQGLGTGQIYTDNIPSPLHLSGDQLAYAPGTPWDYSTLDFHL
ncbi:MAG: o-succinylbenzoate synthase [Candidatus Amulumruptor caecigallinarius]|nr:o-succinylbenzoate synthase [Candidatus Amulumruptor caecigallinarius]MCM1397133.1 o-succinylbenzoate synthase [Candidatus Amulumruptor caecigallinarius]MCM1453943.1 o-succinylbenzoate synthase [bacterium]